MRKLFLLTLFGAIALAGHAAEDGAYMVFEHKDGSLKSIGTEGLSMSISDGLLSAANGSATLTIDMSQLARFYFSSSSGDVTQVFEGMEAGSLEVYDSNGIVLGTFPSIEACREKLPAGVYIVKNRVSTFKIVIR